MTIVSGRDIAPVATQAFGARDLLWFGADRGDDSLASSLHQQARPLINEKVAMPTTLTPYLHMLPGVLLLAGALTDLMGRGASGRGSRLGAALLLLGVLAVAVMMFAAAFTSGSDDAVLWLHRGFAVAAAATALCALVLRPADGGDGLGRRQARMISLGLVGVLAAVALAGGFMAHQHDPGPAPTVGPSRRAGPVDSSVPPFRTARGASPPSDAAVRCRPASPSKPADNPWARAFDNCDKR